MITAVVTCMGRLSHLRITLPFMLECFDRVVVVDWSCPEKSGEFAAELGASVHYKYGEKYYLGSKAKNHGAKVATGDYLAFVDSDSLCLPGLREEINARISPTSMVLSARDDNGQDVNDTVGFIVVPTDAFWNVGGFDEMWQGWGHEDLHLRGKLLLDAKLTVSRLPASGNLGAIAHSNALREQYRIAPIQETAIGGFKVLCRWFKDTHGVSYPYDEKVRSIAFVGSHPEE